MSGPSTSLPFRRRSLWSNHWIIWTLLIVELFPLYMMLQISFKDNASFLQNPWLPSPPFSVTENFVSAVGNSAESPPVKNRVATWSEVFSGAKPSDPSAVVVEKRFDLSVYQITNWRFGAKLIGPFIVNTVFVALSGTLATVGLALLGAYFFARYRMPLSGVLWPAFLILMLLPSVVNLVPLFMLLKDLSLLNTLVALIVVGVASGQAFNILVLRGFIEDLPKDLFEAAEMDGAGHFQQIFHIVIPMSGPIIGTLSILAFLGKWNDFLLPLIVLRDKDLFTLGVGLIYLDGEYVKQWGQIMAAYFIAALPLIVIFLFCMRLFVRGLSAGAIKG
jgi:multiple sugar transport system permease protein